jgi:uncharacterized protein (DUF1684 family)
MRKSWRGFVLFVSVVLVAGVAAVSDDAYVDEIGKYRESRVERLEAPEGWLSLIGLFWLDEGANSFGSATDQAIVLPEDVVPPTAGTFRLEGGEVRVAASKGVAITLDGKPAPERALKDDHAEKPDVLRLGRLSMYVIRRGERFALRVKDPEAETRRAFDGIDYFPLDPSYRVEARFERFDEPRQVQVPTVAGTTSEMLVPGNLVFELHGKSYSLEPLVGTPEATELFIIFRDETSGTETYGAGRYLYATLEEDRAVVDFNKAYNPPCAFTRFATCPLPPRGNRLPVAIRVGERRYGDH